MDDQPKPLEADVLAQLQEIGLSNPDPRDPLHLKLVATLRRMRGQSSGARLVALKYDFNWELVAAGREFAQAKTDYEHHIDREAVRFRIEGEKSGDMALRRANATDEAYTLLLKYRLAEQRERAMRKFLDTLSNAFDNHRTDRADARAGNQFHAQGHDGGA
jgi:hypothetical protein